MPTSDPMDTDGPLPGSVRMDARTRRGEALEAGVIVDWWQRRPVVHAIDPRGRRSLGYRFTVCGWPVNMPPAPLAHLTRVGRPCRRCWAL